MNRRAFLGVTGVALTTLVAGAPSGGCEIIDVEWTRKNGPVWLWDANGNPIHYAVWAELQTGKVTLLMVTEGGKFVIDDDGTGIEMMSRTYPAPLRVEWR